MNVPLILLTNLFYRYNKKIAYKYKNTRTISILAENLDIKGKLSANMASVWTLRVQPSGVSAGLPHSQIFYLKKKTCKLVT